MSKGRVTGILNSSKRSGINNKTQKPWNIMEVEIESEDGGILTADTFDTVTAGDIVELKPTTYTNPNTQKTYNSWNASLPRANNYGPKPAPDSKEVLEAIRMVFRVVKASEAKLDELLGVDVDKMLDREAGAIEQSLPTDKPWEEWAAGNTPEKQAYAQETHVEPMPDEPGDLDTFMNN